MDAAPLDVTTQGDSGAFPGTIWVADIGSGDILAFAPSDNAGGSATDSATLDDDGDGYSNHDELLNGTNPESSADVPADNDHDFVSNLLDGDDDNDGLPDISDPYAVDQKNGASTNLPVKLEFGKDGLGAGGLLNMGFTGLMTNGKTDYAAEYDPSMLTAGGAASVFTLDQVGAGTALGAVNTQQNAFQVGFNVTTASPQFVVHTKVLAPFAGLTPQAGQSMGFYIGTGDQDNYLKMVVSGDQGGSLEIVKEVGGIATAGATVSLSLSGVAEINLYLTVNPASGAVQPSYTVARNGVVGASTNLGALITVPKTWFSNPAIAPAAGLISTRGNAPTFPATWGALEITPLTVKQLGASAPSVDFGAAKAGVTISKTITLKNNGLSGQGPIVIQSVALSGLNPGSFSTPFNNSAPVTLSAGQSLTLTINCKPMFAGNLSALLVINQNGANGALSIPLSASSSAKASVAITLNGGNLGIDASTWTPGSFVVTNNSPDGQKINQLVIDLRNSLLPDLIITPTTAGGDDVPKDLTADSDPAAIGLGTHIDSVPLDGGYQVLTINFTNFGPGKTFKFSFDIDPADIKGGHSPGPNGSGGISGLELTGSSWTASFSDGSTQVAQIYRTPGSVSGGQNIFEAGAPAAPIVELLGVASTPATLIRAAQTVRINGTPGQNVQLLVTEGGLFVSGIPGGGFDLHPYEDNRIGKITEISTKIGANGYSDVPITLTRADANSGFNHIVAVFKSADGRTGTVSNQLLVLFNPSAVDPPPTPISVTSLTLINADTGQAIAGYQSIANGATIDLSKLGTTHLNVRANVSSGTASVLFGFDANANYRIENMAPYALFADDAKGTYYAGTFAVGAHTITATPFTAANASGKAGTALKISFTVIKS